MIIIVSEEKDITTNIVINWLLNKKKHIRLYCQKK